LQPWNAQCKPPWSDKELDHKIDEALTKPFSKLRGYLLNEEPPILRIRKPDLQPPGDAPGPRPNQGPTPPPCELDHLTDAGNAQRLVAVHGEDLHYCHPWGEWLVWDGCRWCRDLTGESMRRAKCSIQHLFGWTMVEMLEIHNRIGGVA